jgi:endoglucanase
MLRKATARFSAPGVLLHMIGRMIRRGGAPAGAVVAVVALALAVPTAPRPARTPSSSDGPAGLVRRTLDVTTSPLAPTTDGATATAAAGALPDVRPALPTSATSTASIVDAVVGQVTVPSGTATVTPELVYTDGGTVVATVAGPPVRAVSGRWTNLAQTVALAPAGATAVHVALTSTGALPEARHVLLLFRRVSTPPVVGPLHTSGNRILQADGRPAVLHGIDLVALLSPTTAGSVTQEQLETIRAWGANLVRISVGEQFLLPGQCQYDPTYLSDLQRVVQWTTDLGMVALIDLHESEPVMCLGAGDQDMADDPGSVDFWQTVAGLFATNPLVAFDLYNEPHDISPSVWLDGGTATDYLPYPAAGMQQLYDAVRSTGAQNLVFVSGDDWAAAPPTTLVDGTNIVYSVHDYTCPVSAPPSCSNAQPYDPAPILERWVPLARRVPVFVGEFGWPSTTSGVYNQTVIDLANRLGWGWDAFSWNTGPFGLLSGVLPGQPNLAGMPVLAALASI